MMRPDTRPAALEAASLRLGKQVQPRHAAGEADPRDGRIALISIGLANTRGFTRTLYNRTWQGLDYRIRRLRSSSSAFPAGVSVGPIT
jgi:hypothetical protein